MAVVVSSASRKCLRECSTSVVAKRETHFHTAISQESHGEDGMTLRTTNQEVTEHCWLIIIRLRNFLSHPLIFRKFQGILWNSCKFGKTRENSRELSGVQWGLVWHVIILNMNLVGMPGGFRGNATFAIGGPP